MNIALHLDESALAAVASCAGRGLLWKIALLIRKLRARIFFRHNSASRPSA
jgi:hypothetical protein